MCGTEWSETWRERTGVWIRGVGLGVMVGVRVDGMGIESEAGSLVGREWACKAIVGVPLNCLTLTHVLPHLPQTVTATR